ncbi:hypothetical protein ACFPK9_09375 [Rubritalea spongiae]|uniref:Outer membrane protein beta-barrel domain-containing protein n=1 Tax=Rubritalea spongiae TaxID=430797 RepID=A0ABW5E4R8_9BACT
MLKNLTCISISLALASHNYAGDFASGIDSSKSTPITLPETNAWEFKIAPYIWFSGIDGTSGVPALPPAEIDASFGDIWDNLDFAGFLAFEANKGKWRIFSDLQYVNLGTNATLPSGIDLQYDLEQVRLEVGAGYEVYSNETTSLSVYAAAMYNYINQELSGGGMSEGLSESWIDPAIGLTLRHRLSNKWKSELSAEYGGFDVSSEETWQLLAILGYDITQQWAVVGGYRYQSIDYEDDGFIYDTNTHGPFLGVAYSF